MSLGDLLVSIMDAAKELLDAEGCSLLLDDPKTDDLIFDVVVGEKGDIIRGERIPVGATRAGGDLHPRARHGVSLAGVGQSRAASQW